MKIFNIFAVYDNIFAILFMMRKVTERKIIYEANTGLKHIQTGKELDKSIILQHKHEDYEILVITQDAGRCFVGEQVIEYEKGNILCIGRNVPHCYLSKKQSIENKYYHEGEILQFRRELFPVKMEDLLNFTHIHNLLLKSQHGLIFKDDRLYKKVKDKVLNVDNLKGIEKITELYKILDLLGRSKKGLFISCEKFDANNNVFETQEFLHKAYNYIYNNFKHPITLEEVAEQANLNPTALCRAFKRKTGVTIFQFLTRLRIENACKLLSYTDLNISQIAYESGFNNIANFNRHFKIVTKSSPTKYREQMSGIY